MKWFLKCFRHYADFEGRARRAEYWYFVLFTILCALTLTIVDFVLFGPKGFHPFSSLFSLAIFLPQLAVTVRRLHDIGRSGWELLWYYVTAIVVVFVLVGATVLTVMRMGAATAPVFSGITLVILTAGYAVLVGWGIRVLVLLCRPGQRGANCYDADPLETPEEN